MEAFSVAFEAVAPVFALIILGLVVKKKKIVNDDFVRQATRLVFRVCLPVLLFQKVAGVDLYQEVNRESIALMLYVAVAAILAYIAMELIASRLLHLDMNEGGYVRGSFVQGAFRSNYALIGYPLLLNLFDDKIVVGIALTTLVGIPAFNILSVIALSPRQGKNAISPSQLIKRVISNPLVIATLLGFVSAALRLTYPSPLENFLDMVGSVSSPLGIIAIGAFFQFDGFKSTFRLSLLATTIKLLIEPMIVSAIAFFLGFSPMNVILVAVIFGGPTAVSSFAMSVELGGDPETSGNIVILTTGLCLISFMVLLTFWIQCLHLAN